MALEKFEYTQEWFLKVDEIGAFICECIFFCSTDANYDIPNTHMRLKSKFLEVNEKVRGIHKKIGYSTKQSESLIKAINKNRKKTPVEFLCIEEDIKALVKAYEGDDDQSEDESSGSDEESGSDSSDSDGDY